MISEVHRQWIRSRRCARCGCNPGLPGNPIEAAHVRMGTGGGMGLKPSDVWLVPLCHREHRLQHSHGERTFWSGTNVYEVVLGYAENSPDPAIRALAPAVFRFLEREPEPSTAADRRRAVAPTATSITPGATSPAPTGKKSSG